VVGDGRTSELVAHRRALWDYYNRRVTGRPPAFENAHAYWTGLGVEVEIADIAYEAAQLTDKLRELSPVPFVDVGAGPGTFTSLVPGPGIALDQSRRALEVLRAQVPGIPAAQADALRLPLPDGAVVRFFSSHVYGLLLPSERQVFLAEARRVASELILVDAGRPKGVRAEEWQERRLPDGGAFKVFRRHFDADVLAAEVGGDVLFAGRFYVLVSVVSSGSRDRRRSGDLTPPSF
jgi:SAM-dependent methyltransferase